MKRRLIVLLSILLAGFAAFYTRDWWFPALAGYWPGLKQFVENNANFFQGLSGLVQLILWIAAPLVGLWLWLVDRKSSTLSPQPDSSQPAANALDKSPSPSIPTPPDPTYPRHGVERLPDHFVARPLEMERIRNELLRPDRPGKLALLGMGGLGKTTLARAVAFEARCKSVYPDGVLWGQLRPSAVDESAADEIMRTWMIDLQAGDPKEFPRMEDKARLLTKLLAKKRYLIVLDDLWHASVARPLLGVAGELCGVLVTARDQQQVATLPLHPLRLDTLQADEALDLLQKRCHNPITTDELPAAKELLQRVGYLPLAVELAAANLNSAGGTLQGLLQALRSSGGSLDALQIGDAAAREESLHVCIEISLRSLSEELQQRYGWLGVMAADGNFSAEEAAGLWQMEASSASRLLNRLIDAALLDLLATPEAPMRYRLHALLSDYALGRLRVSGELESALLRHANLYVDLAEVLNHPSQFAAIHPQLQAALRRCWRAWMSDAPTEMQIESGLQLPAVVAQPLFDRLIYASYLGYWEIGGLPSESLIWLPRAIYSAEKADNKQNQCAHLGNLGTTYAELGEMGKAIASYEIVLAISRELGDQKGVSASLGNLGNVYRNFDQIEEALSYYKDVDKWKKQ